MTPRGTKTLLTIAGPLYTTNGVSIVLTIPSVWVCLKEERVCGLLMTQTVSETHQVMVQHISFLRLLSIESGLVSEQQSVDLVPKK